MARTRRKQDDVEVFIELHVPGDQCAAAAATRVDRLLDREVPTGYRRVFVSDLPAGGELVYGLQVPVVMPARMREFFTGLRNILSSTSDMCPHFTQEVS